MGDNKNQTINLEEVRRQNLAAVIRMIHDLKVCSRATIAELSGLQQSTITNLVNLLLDSGIVKEIGLIEGRRGRRSIGITLCRDKFLVAGIRLTRNSFSVGLFDINGECRVSVKKGYDASSPTDSVLDGIQRETSALIQASELPVIAIGAAVPGPFLVKESRFMRVSSMSGWEGINIRECLCRFFDIPVYVEHDANAGILAERWFGKYRLEHGTYLYIAAGYGVGAGIMIDGAVFHGAIGTAGEVGHMSIDVHGPKCSCGNNGCLEMYASTHAVEEYVAGHRQTDGKSPLQFNDILDAFFDGDTLAREAVSSSASFLARGLANLINICDPDGILIGDELAKTGILFLEEVKSSVKNLVSSELFDATKIVLSSFDQDAAFVGAGALAVAETLQNPNALLSLQKG